MKKIQTTKDTSYTKRLERIQQQWWKRWFSPLDPYGMHIRSIIGERNLEVGCGIGRVLNFSPAKITGIDHNPDSIKLCLERRLSAFTPDEFHEVAQKNSYDTLIISHVLEHMSFVDGVKLISEYQDYLTPNARLILITPQERGFQSDRTHAEFSDFKQHLRMLNSFGAKCIRQYSFPFPRIMGKYYIYNEFVTIGGLF